MKYGTFHVKMHIRLFYCSLLTAQECQTPYFSSPKRTTCIMLGILPPSLLLTLWGEHVGAFSIKHLLSSKGPLFPFQWSLRFHDTVYLTDSQLKFSSGIHEIHIKGRKKIKQKKSFHLSFVEVRKQLTLRLISWHGSHKTMGRAPMPAPHYRHPLPACMGWRICRRLWALG